MTPRVNGILTATGAVGVRVSEVDARRLANIAAANALSAISAAVGGLGLITACVQLRVYIAVGPRFSGLSRVANGATASLCYYLGARGLGARTAVGMVQLPSGAPVEVDLVVALRRPRGEVHGSAPSLRSVDPAVLGESDLTTT